MIDPTGYRLRCDHRYSNGDRCPATYEADSYFGPRGIHEHAERTGWQLNVKLNGQSAMRGGKDYCLTHRRGERE